MPPTAPSTPTPRLPPDLPPEVAAYFATDATVDLDAFVALFSPGVVVVDDGHTHTGPSGVRAWKEGTTQTFTYTTEVIAHEEVAPGRHVVTGHLTGDFPGGEVDLTYAFQVADGLVTRLEIGA